MQRKVSFPNLGPQDEAYPVSTSQTSTISVRFKRLTEIRTVV